MNDIQIFNHAEFGSVRTLTINGEPYFVGKDVAEILGYADPNKAVRVHVDEEDKGVDEMDTPGGKQKMTVINESGLYALILGSKLPAAKAFKRWVTADVLPSIRKHGLYAVDEIIENPDLVIDSLIALREERRKRKEAELMVAMQNQQIAEMQPKVSYYDKILQNKGTVTITQIAKDYGMSGRQFNQILSDMGIQFRMGKVWLLYQKYAEQGYTQSRTFAVNGDRNVMHTYWTQKGRLFLYDLLKAEGILPTGDAA